MKNKQVVLIAILCILVVILSVVNVYMSVQNNHESDRKIERAIQQIKDQKPLPGPMGPIGPQGQTVVGPKGDRGDMGNKGDKGDDGKDAVVDYDKIKSYVDQKIAEELAKLPKAKDGRTPIINIDPETGDVLMKYNGDTLWTLLVERCKLTSTCEE